MNNLIKSIQMENLLSFGSENSSIPLRSLNVIIGPNGSGKSNVIEAISLLQATPNNLASTVRKGGGVREWLWKGCEEVPTARLEVVLPSATDSQMDLRYQFAFTAVNQRFEIVDECLETAKPYSNDQENDFFFWYQNNRPVLSNKQGKRLLKREDLNPEQSVLSQRKDPDQYPELTWVGKQFEQIQIYRDWSFGRKAPLRQPQSVDAPNDFLAEDCSNLGLILSSLRRIPKVKKKILELLAELYQGIDDFDVSIEGGTVQIFLQEGDYTIPATRLSDGTLRYLGLIAILSHPKPPSLICIEEPELGLHRDIMPVIAKMLKEASERTQLIITTHSEALVDVLSDMPETVLVCEKYNGSTHLERLDNNNLNDWLKKYSLGQLWSRGDIGGNRW